MAKCLWCGNKDAYVGFNEIECPNSKCRAYVPTKKRRKARVAWDVNGFVGHSRWLTLEEAQHRAKVGNDKHGAGTHWVEDGDIEWVFAID